jgi:hypothetical protein
MSVAEFLRGVIEELSPCPPEKACIEAGRISSSIAESEGISSLSQLRMAVYSDAPYFHRKYFSRLSDSNMRFLIEKLALSFLNVASVATRAREVTTYELPSGLTILDRHLGGGFLAGTITEIFGEAGVGKTQVLLHTMIHNALRGRSTIYLVSEDIPHTRIQQLVEHHAAASGTSATTILSLIFIRKISDAADLISVIRGGSLSKQIELCRAAAVLLDSIAMCCRNSREAALIGGMLKEVVWNAGAPIPLVVSNQVRANVGPSSHLSPTIAALGLPWSYCVDTRINISRANGSRTLSVLYSPAAPPCQMQMDVRGEGVVLFPFPD